MALYSTASRRKLVMDVAQCQRLLVLPMLMARSTAAMPRELQAPGSLSGETGSDTDEGGDLILEVAVLISILLILLLILKFCWLDKQDGQSGAGYQMVARQQEAVEPVAMSAAEEAQATEEAAGATAAAEEVAATTTAAEEAQKQDSQSGTGYQMVARQQEAVEPVATEAAEEAQATEEAAGATAAAEEVAAATTAAEDAQTAPSDDPSGQVVQAKAAHAVQHSVSEEVVAVAHEGEIGTRLKIAGAKVGALTCSLLWNNTDDLDLHCESPTGDHIYWNMKRGKCGGHLDVDMNASDKHLEKAPVENMYWDEPPPGKYRFWVENNTVREDCDTPFTVRLTRDGAAEDKHFDDLAEYDEIVAFEFTIGA